MASQFLFHQAASLHQSGKLAQAETLYKQVLEAEPGNYQARYLFAFLCYQQRKPEALAAIEAALKLNPDGVDAIMLHGALLLEAGRHEEALADFSRATALKPDHAEAWHNRGIVLAHLARLGEAVAAFDRALAIRPSGQIWNGRGAALQELKRFEDALQSFDCALADAPGLLWARYNRGIVLLALDRSLEAVTAFDQVLIQNPSLPEAWNNRGVALQQLRRFADSLASYDKALAIGPDYAAGWSNRAALLQSLNRFDEAVASYDEALAIRPDNARDWINRAAALRGLKRHEEALESYDRAIALLPDDAEAWCGRAQALHALRRFPEIMANLDKALMIDPDYPPALSSRAAFLCEVNRVAEGIAVYRRRAQLVYRSTSGPAIDDPPHKKRHDAEQRAYLAARGVALHEGMFHLAEGERLAGPAVNAVNGENIAAQWQSSHPQIVVIDNLLSDDALENLQRFCWDSTIWRKAYKNGYLGAMPAHGFACPLLAQISEEMCRAFPSIFGEHGLTMFWAFKYDSDLGGIRIHADQAVVNVNFWITPDEANRNPENGGLVIWDAKAPSDWDITKYNGDDDAVRAFLAEAGAKSTRVPYRANRAVIFDSDLFHETDVIEFKEGYLNRRINITLLYGRRPFDAS